jgi:hypothetical protein
MDQVEEDLKRMKIIDTDTDTACIGIPFVPVVPGQVRVLSVLTLILLTWSIW